MVDSKDDVKIVQILVTLYLDPDADPDEVVEDMDYEFRHPNIRDSEIDGIEREF